LVPTTAKWRFCAVVSSTAGVFIAISLYGLLRQEPFGGTTSTRGMLVLLLMELLMAAYWVPALRRAGWTLPSITAPFAALDILRGIGLYLGAMVAYITIWVLVAMKLPVYLQKVAAIQFGGEMSWWSAGLASVINPVAEEFLYLGSVANVLRSRSTASAFWGSVLVRVAVHLYQGPLALIAIAPIGAVWTSYYLGSRRIWPAVVAHAVMDLHALGQSVTWAA